jgi:hypothetical protein
VAAITQRIIRGTFRRVVERFVIAHQSVS